MKEPAQSVADVLDPKEFVTCEDGIKLLTELYDTDLAPILSARSENLKILKTRLHRSAISKIFKSYFSIYNPSAHISFESLSYIALSTFSQFGFYANAPQSYVYLL